MKELVGVYWFQSHAKIAVADWEPVLEALCQHSQLFVCVIDRNQSQNT
jgi:hypothetical protein